MKAGTSRLVYIFMMLTYLSVPIVHDVLPYFSELRGGDWLALMGMYVVGIVATLPMMYLAFKLDVLSHIKGRSFYLRALTCLILQYLCIALLWGDSAALYVGMTILMFTSYIIMYIRRDDLLNSATIIKDTSTGGYYMVQNGHHHRLSDVELNRYIAAISLSGRHGMSNVESGTGINPAAGLPMNNGEPAFDAMDNSWGSNLHDTSVNPSTGLPMNGGMSGLDVGGNSWGTSFNDPSGSQNSYDPNRGY